MNSPKRRQFWFWLITLAAVLGVGLSASLGFWQLGRAEQKQALQAMIEQQASLPALNNAGAGFLHAKEPATLHRRAVLTGKWLPQHTVFLDNRQMDGKPGFFVVTPFELTEPVVPFKQIILVQRGWVARHFLDRNQLPALPTPSGLVTIEGRIAPPPSKLFEFKGADNGQIRQNIDLMQFSQQTQLDFVHASLLQSDAQPHAAAPSDGLLRHWAKPTYGVEKHYGYMFQWWALSVLIGILYIWFQIVRPVKLKRKLQRELALVNTSSSVN